MAKIFLRTIKKVQGDGGRLVRPQKTPKISKIIFLSGGRDVRRRPWSLMDPKKFFSHHMGSPDGFKDRPAFLKFYFGESPL